MGRSGAGRLERRLPSSRSRGTQQKARNTRRSADPWATADPPCTTQHRRGRPRRPCRRGIALFPCRGRSASPNLPLLRPCLSPSEARPSAEGRHPLPGQAAGPVSTTFSGSFGRGCSQSGSQTPSKKRRGGINPGWAMVLLKGSRGLLRLLRHPAEYIYEYTQSKRNFQAIFPATRPCGRTVRKEVMTDRVAIAPPKQAPSAGLPPRRAVTMTTSPGLRRCPGKPETRGSNPASGGSARAGRAPGGARLPRSKPGKPDPHR
jgi:hypothetical protein